MSDSITILELGGINVDRTRPLALHAQIYGGVRDAIVNRQLPPGIRLPSTRTLSETWKVSRSTLITAFDQLMAEGYLRGQTGAGTFVNEIVPDEFVEVENEPTRQNPCVVNGGQLPGISQRGEEICQQYVTRRKPFDRPLTFRPGIPAHGTFPSQLWRRLTSKVWHDYETELRPLSDAMGHGPLREVIADHLRTSRGVACEARQVVVVSSTQQSLALLGQMLLDPGDPVWIEDPGYLRAQAALKAVGADLIPVPVDAEGFDLSAAVHKKTPARMVYVTPSCQYPLGISMSLKRRRELISWAREHDAWIVEDDYMADYRLSGQPLKALQGLGQHERVIYAGTFSKTFSPMLRLGFLVIPPSLIEPFEAMRSLIDRPPSFIDQAVLAAFIRKGHYGKHVRKMRVLYSKRQEALRLALARELPSLQVHPATTGMHVLAWLPPGVCDRDVSQLLARESIIAPALSNGSLLSNQRNALVLGYAGWSPVEIDSGVKKMAVVLKHIL